MDPREKALMTIRTSGDSGTPQGGRPSEPSEMSQEKSSTCCGQETISP